MEILQITGGRMKITLTREDLTEYRIDCARLDYADPASKEALDAVLAIAEAKVGASLRGKQTYIQLYPSRDGGCEIFVLKKQERKKLSVKETAPVKWEEQNGVYLCTFEEQKKALELKKRLALSGEDAPLYEMENKYLLVAKAVSGTVLLLEEYGRRPGADPTPYLSEHAKRIAIE